jgi:hypothetical protein
LDEYADEFVLNCLMIWICIYHFKVCSCNNVQKCMKKQKEKKNIIEEGETMQWQKKGQDYKQWSTEYYIEH